MASWYRPEYLALSYSSPDVGSDSFGSHFNALVEVRWQHVVGQGIRWHSPARRNLRQSRDLLGFQVLRPTIVFNCLETTSAIQSRPFTPSPVKAVDDSGSRWNRKPVLLQPLKMEGECPLQIVC